MRKTIIAIGLAGLFTGSAFAALPPQYQRQAELRAIIDNPDVVDVFGFDGISSVEHVGTDLYLVRGGACALEVTIKDTPNTHDAGWVGPREFTTVPGKPVCN